MRSPSLPPLSADGDSIQEVYRKQSTQIGELEKDKKRLEKELEETTGRWRKTEEQLEDLQETTADMAELKDKLEKAEQKVTEIDALVSSYPPRFPADRHTDMRSERGNCFSSATELTPPVKVSSQQCT